jgi:beta-mannosidase
MTTSASRSSSPSPKKAFDLSALQWTVSGFWPHAWKGKSLELGFALEAEIGAIPAHVPGSVQDALQAAALIPDWNMKLNSRDCEWVEHRDWMFSTILPDAWFTSGRRFILSCPGLDGPGVVIFNAQEIGSFDNSFVPHSFDLTPFVQPTGNRLHVIFSTPPQWLGQIGYTSQMTDWKVRFNYGWDWIPRLVQIGPCKPMRLEVTEVAELSEFRARTDWNLAEQTGTLWMKATLKGAATNLSVRFTLLDCEAVLRAETIAVQSSVATLEWKSLSVSPWWPNGEGETKLYQLKSELIDASGNILDRSERRVGFKHIEWRPCANAPAKADPWICVVNGKPVFLQGVNWTPIRPNFADLTQNDYQELVTLYAHLGCNILRVWGGAFLERTWFYDLCDELGLLVWQEFPLSSASHENWPPEDKPSMHALVEIARSYVVRRQHHASLLMWCGGNELQGAPDGGKVGIGKPVGLDHPLMQRWQALINVEDPGRRFMPSSSSGPQFCGDLHNFGKGLHWDVHGPWKTPGATPAEWSHYWKHDDALFRSETGAPGTSSAEIIREYFGPLPALPATLDNPIWRRFSWWLEQDEFIRDKGHEPTSLDEYVEWSQARQAHLVELAVRSCKERFPAIGGVILWMGHDSFPCPINTSIIDFHGQPKPAALAASAIWKNRDLLKSHATS